MNWVKNIKNLIIFAVLCTACATAKEIDESLTITTYSKDLSQDPYLLGIFDEKHGMPYTSKYVHSWKRKEYKRGRLETRKQIRSNPSPFAAAYRPSYEKTKSAWDMYNHGPMYNTFAANIQAFR